MMANVLDFFIRAKDKTGAATGSAGKGFRSMATKIIGVVVAIKAAIASFKALGRVIKESIKEAMKIDAAKNPFIRFVGSAKAAKEHIKGLRQIARFGLFNLDELIDASRKLMNISDGALGSVANMKWLGDAATTVGHSIGETADSVGRFLSYMKAGREVSRAAMALEGLGLVGDGVVAKLDKMQKAGASMVDMWKIMEKGIDRFAGGLEDDSTLGMAAIGRLKNAWQEGLYAIGAALGENIGWLDKITNKILEMIETGKIEEWANKFVNKIKEIATELENLRKKLRWLFPSDQLIIEYITRRGKEFVKEPFKAIYQNPYMDEWVRKRAGLEKELEEVEKRKPEKTQGEKWAEYSKKNLDYLKERNKITKQLEEAEDKIASAAAKKELWESNKKGAIDFYNSQKNQIIEIQRLREKGFQKEAENIQKTIDLNKEKYKHLRKMAVDPEYRRSQEGEAREAAKEEQSYNRLLGRARGKVAHRQQWGTGARLSESEKLALDAAGMKGGATDVQKALAQKEMNAMDAEIASAETLKSIDGKIESITALQA